MRGSIRPTKRSREEHRQHVPAPTPLGWWDEELPDVVELEERPEQAAVPHQRVERRQERDGRRRLAGAPPAARPPLVRTKRLPRHALHLDRNELAPFDELLAQRVPTRALRDARVRLGRADAAEHVIRAADAEQAVGAVPREELVPELLRERDVAREDVRRQQPLEQVVVAAVAVASREAEHARHGVRLEHRAARCSSAARTSRSSSRARARNRAPTAAPRRGCARARARRPRRSRRGRAPRSGSTCRGTTGTRPPGRRRGPCCTPRRSRGARRAGRTRRGRSRPRARAGRGRGCDRRSRADRTGSSRDDGRPRARRPVLPRANARERARGARRESGVRPQQ